MNEIQVLSQETIDRIAAGEVVERPASVVKELVENAVDAGANAVTVEIRDGGTKLIRITDNGCGIPKDQVPTAFLSHATSKIRQVEDLMTSGTLGFRGEALSSIAAVSQVELLTKTAGSLVGVRYVIEGGAEKSREEVGIPEGTTFLVHNLFYNTPARKKFLKSAATEAGYVSDLMERMALSHPHISFKFISNGETKLHTSGNNNLKDIIYSVYGREIAANVVKVEADYGNLHICGFLGKPVISRGNRNYENYFVNGRYVKNAIVARAIEDAYKSYLMNRRYPFTVLTIDLDTEELDVNVHPQKLEVRFANQQEIYERVCQTVREGLLGRELIPEFTLDRDGVSDARGGRMKTEAVRSEGGASGSLTGQTKQEASRESQAAIFSGKLPNLRESSRELLERAGIPGGRRTSGNETAAQETSESGQSISSQKGPSQAEAGCRQAAQDKDIPVEVHTSGQTAGGIRYPEPFEKIRSRLIAEANSPYEVKYPQRDRRAGTMKPVTGMIVPEKEPQGKPEQTSGNLFQGEETALSETGTHTVPISGQQPLSETAMPSATVCTQTEDKKLRSEEGMPVDSSILQAVEEDARKIREEEQQKLLAGQQMELFGEKLLAEASRPRHKLVGQVFGTYWIVEFEDKMYIIDQHAAHEKVMYERFMKEYREKRQTSQMITPPVIVTLNAQEEELLRRHKDRFDAVGFEIAPFGGREYAISAVPGNLYGLASRELFVEILDGLSDVSETASDQIVTEKIASMSCKAAVKGNHRFSAAEADALIDELLQLENPYNCPHGRPTIISMTQYELEKKFKRVV